jgi:ATP-dependent RNA helicase RhlE
MPAKKKSTPAARAKTPRAKSAKRVPNDATTPLVDATPVAEVVAPAVAAVAATDAVAEESLIAVVPDGATLIDGVVMSDDAELVPSFGDLGLLPELVSAVEDAGYTTPTPIQARAIPIALRGRDLIGLAQTGTGKTASFTLPMVQRLHEGPRRTRALVLTPTRELCMQVEESVRKYAKHSQIDVIAVFGGVPYEPQEKALRGGVDVVVATPGRLIDHLEKQNVVFDELEMLVLDEADRMLDMGFAPQLSKIVQQIHPYRQTLLFSATMPPEVEALARKYLRQPIVVQVGRRSSAAATISHCVYPVPHHRKAELLSKLLKEMDAETVLVFTRTKSGADRVVERLETDGIAATAMHADKSQVQRTRAIEDFKSGKIRVLVATDIAQRGLDINGISHVINYDVPQQPEDYVHRIGRTGRALTTGDAFTFMSADEIGMVRTIERTLGSPIPRISVPGFDFGT